MFFVNVCFVHLNIEIKNIGIMKKLFRIMYIIVDRKGNGQPYSLSYQKKMCTDAFIKGSSITWNEAKKHGWKCIKVDVHITPSSNFDGWN